MMGYLTILSNSLPKMTSSDPNEVKGMFELPFKLKLPNKEIRMLFEETVVAWFKEKILADNRKELFEALWNGDSTKLAGIISCYLRSTISYTHK